MKSSAMTLICAKSIDQMTIDELDFTLEEKLALKKKFCALGYDLDKTIEWLILQLRDLDDLLMKYKIKEFRKAKREGKKK